MILPFIIENSALQDAAEKALIKANENGQIYPWETYSWPEQGYLTFFSNVRPFPTIADTIS
jgi:hypothetical protein